MKELKEKILRESAADLAAVEISLKENLGAQVDLTSVVAGHILFAGGKRLRPLLMIACARLCGYGGDRAPHYSTMFEYLHAATLIHDDLVDDGALRRGRETAHRRFGNEIAVLTGDFLLARSLAIAAETESMGVIRMIAAITEEMSQGEIHQLSRIGDISLSESEYMEIIYRKTAVLMEGACKTGALVAGMPEETAMELARFGRNLGLAFQMADDLLDYTAKASVMGKPPGADLREGKLTLPLIRTLAAADPAETAFIASMVSAPEIDPRDFVRLVALMHEKGGITTTVDSARDHIRKAHGHLAAFPGGPAKNLLLAIAEYALARRA